MAAALPKVSRGVKGPVQVAGPRSGTAWIPGKSRPSHGGIAGSGRVHAGAQYRAGRIIAEGDACLQRS